MLLVYVGLLPAALAAALRLMRSRRAREICAVVFSFLISGAIGYALWGAGNGRAELFRLSDDFVCALRLDGAGKIYIGLAALLWPFAMLYAVEYMRHEDREGNFFAWYLAAYGAAFFLAAAENLFTLYIFYELLTLCTVPLVWHKRDEESTKAALIYMLYLIGGAALGFAAVILMPSVILSTDGVFRLGGYVTLRGDADPRAAWVALLGFVGFGVKAAVLPFCRWLPKASAAPTPVTALLHAVAVVNAGVFAVLRVLYYTISTAFLRNAWVQPVMLVLSAATIVYAAAMAVREEHVKRRLAWSTVSNLSYMLLGLSLLTEQGMAAGLSHMVFHSLMKIILFFCAGAVTVSTGRTKAHEMHGLGKKLPFSFLCFTLAGLSLLGVPPLPGFVSKYALVAAALSQGGAFALAGAVSLLLAAVLTAIYIFTIVYPAFFMRFSPLDGKNEFTAPGACMKISFAVLSLLLLGASFFAGPVMDRLASLAGGVFP